MVGDFYGTRIEIWAGFGPVGITEKKTFGHFWRPVFRSSHGQKN